jgi:hypothetical protein
VTRQEGQRRLLFILHRGLVETRLLAQGRHNEQLFDLADTLEVIPGRIDRWEECDIDLLRFNLQKYREKYPTSLCDYVRYLDRDPVPERF